MSPPASKRRGERAPRVVVDTNVWVSGLILPDGAPGRVLEAVAAGAVTAVASWALAEELVEVLRRPRLRRYRISEEDIQDVLRTLGPLLPSIEVDVEARDPDDGPVIAAAVAGGAQAIVTGDADLLDDEVLRSWLSARGIEVFTPVELLGWLAL